MFKVLKILIASAILTTNLQAKMALKTKSCKCFVVAHDLASIEKCFVKAISRNTSTLNVVSKLKKTFEAPIYVSLFHQDSVKSVRRYFSDRRQSQLPLWKYLPRSDQSAEVRMVRCCERYVGEPLPALFLRGAEIFVTSNLPEVSFQKSKQPFDFRDIV